MKVYTYITNVIEIFIVRDPFDGHGGYGPVYVGLRGQRELWYV